MLQISTVVGCNIGCSYCPQSSHTSAYEDLVKGSGPYEMSFETFKTCIDKLPYKAPVSFGGFSEPFANPHILEMLEYCKKTRRRIHIHTTLRGLKFKDIDRVMATFPHRLYIHMPDEEGYMNPPIGKEYFKVINKFREYYKRKYRIGLVCIGTPIAELVEGFGPIDFLPISSMDNERGTFNGHDFLEEVYKDVPNPIRDRQDFDYSVRCKRSKRLHETVLVPNGDVYACIMDYKLELKICNLLTDSWDAHEDGRIRIIKQQQSDDKNIKCNTCDFARMSNTRAQRRRERAKELEKEKIEEGKKHLAEIKRLKKENEEIKRKLNPNPNDVPIANKIIKGKSKSIRRITRADLKGRIWRED